MKQRFHWLAAASLVLAATAGAQRASTWKVLYERKISASAGGFGGSLDGADRFGNGLALLGDLDGDGVPELAAGAPSDDDGGTNRGALWILDVARDGTVQGQRKVSALEGGFKGLLDDRDSFGFSLAGLGDLDGDGVPDLAVGALLDDDGGTDRGAVWVLFLEAGGSVKACQKVSDTAGGFAGTLLDGDQFGSSVEALGDLDGDGVVELAVGARRDDDGGRDRGAVWILFLNADGTVKQHAKISASAGGFRGALGDGALFGSGIADLGDLDGVRREGHPGANSRSAWPSASPKAIAVGAPHSGQGTGELWVLFLSSTGTVLAEQEIEEGAGGFTGDLDPSDAFGCSVESLLGGAGVIELAVGAPRDDDGAPDAGAVWILSLAPDGSVASQAKISATRGDLEGPLEAADTFGTGLGALGDLDRDGRRDLAVGARLDDDGSRNAGALYVLFLGNGTLAMLAGSTTWTGAVSSAWTDASNWTNGVPDSTTSAEIPDAATTANDPVVSDNLQACNALLVQPGGLLVLDGIFSVHGGATVQGSVTGTGELHAAGAGVFSGAGTISVKTVFDQDVTVQGGPLTIAEDLDVHEDLTVDPGAELVVSGTAVLDPTTTAELSGTGTLDLDGAVDLQMSDGTSVPLLELSGSLTVDSSVYSPSSGTVRFDGTTTQSVTQLSAGATAFADVEVTASADVMVTGDLLLTGDLDLQGALDVSSDIEIDDAFQGGSVSNLSAGGITFGGDIEHGGSLSTSQAIVITEPSSITLVIDASQPFPTDLDIDVEGRVVLVSDLEVLGDLNVLDGTFAAGVDTIIDVQALAIESGAGMETEAFSVSLVDDPTIEVRGELSVEPDGTLRLSASPVSIESGGTLRVDESTVRGVAGGGYALTVGAGATVAARKFVFRDMGVGGVFVHRDAFLGAPPFDLHQGLFTRPAPGGVLLHIERAATASLQQLQFEDPLGVAANNVRSGLGSAVIKLRFWNGRFAGPTYEDDPLGLLDWGPAKARGK